jgi:mRNA-degrading endonuclease YafQ of YafQ-DinJ toxin-antitoxin module
MKVITDKRYDRSFADLDQEAKHLTKENIELFEIDPYNPSLRNHPLDPPLERYRTISVDDDLKILFRMADNYTALFLKIGTHEEIYKRL